MSKQPIFSQQNTPTNSNVLLFPAQKGFSVKIQDAFEVAAKLNDNQQCIFLQRLSVSDPVVFREVHSLLKYHKIPSQALENVVYGAAKGISKVLSIRKYRLQIKTGEISELDEN